ncbi:MAG: class I SAM-dependent methyltransferase [candidate division Zixibacteria bacterium]|nr:class I SAM-dependent methyltransferase [candidate division Zixibacteria bacterium]
MKKQKSVFEVYAHEYDLITNAAQREAYHTREVKSIIERFKPQKVLDAGCATGLTALLFARQGVETVGLDRSRSMIKQAQETRSDTNLSLDFQYGSFERLPKRMYRQFDLVVCLANSISGVANLSDLRKVMINFRAILRSGGHLVLQMLNYSAITADTLMTIKATENDGIVYERFSERKGRSLFVYVSRADFNQTPPKFEVFRHQFDNYTPEQMLRCIKDAGFVKSKKFANLYLDKRFSRKGRDLVITAMAAD